MIKDVGAIVAVSRAQEPLCIEPRSLAMSKVVKGPGASSKHVTSEVHCSAEGSLVQGLFFQACFLPNLKLVLAQREHEIWGGWWRGSLQSPTTTLRHPRPHSTRATHNEMRRGDQTVESRPQKGSQRMKELIKLYRIRRSDKNGKKKLSYTLTLNNRSARSHSGKESVMPQIRTKEGKKLCGQHAGYSTGTGRRLGKGRTIRS